MDIKEAYDAIYEHVNEECNKQNICSECLYHEVCEMLSEMPPYVIGEFRKVYLKHQYNVNNKVGVNKELVDNPYFHRVYANKGDKLLCIDDGGSYTTYDDFFKDNGYRYFLSNYKHAALTPGMIYTVVAVYPHRNYSCNVYILKNDNEDVFLCTDDTDYLYKIQPNARPWTDRSKDRLMKIHDNNSVFGLSFRCVPGGHLFVRSFLTSKSLFMPNAIKRSTKSIQGTLNKFIKDNILV